MCLALKSRQFLGFLLFFFPLFLPLGVSDGFGEHKIPPIQIHDAILQVKLPLVLTSVNLKHKKWSAFHFKKSYNFSDFLQPIMFCTIKVELDGCHFSQFHL